MEGPAKDRAALRWFTGAWDVYTSGFLALLPVLLVQTAVSAVSPFLIHKYRSLLPALPYLLLVVTPVSTGAGLVYIRMARGGRARLPDLFSAFPVYHRAVAVSLGLGLLTLGGTLAFLLPGLVLYLTYCFSEFAVVDRRTGVRDSFALSRALTLGWRLRLLPIVLLMLLINAFAPDIVVMSGPMKAPVIALDLKPWTVAASLLKNFVFLPWLGLALASAYDFLLTGPVPALEEPQDADGL